jgi:hypothetical protein
VSGPIRRRTILARLHCEFMKDDEYRQQAKDAQGLADRAKNPSDREAWLRIAQSWMGLIRRPPRTAAERFDDKAKGQGTGQEDSQKSH